MALESSPIATVGVGPGGGIMLTNRALESLTGYRREDLLDRPLDLLIPDEVRGKHRELCEAFLREPAERAMGRGRDLRVRRRDGTCFPAEIGLNPVEGPEGTVVLAAIVDLTERKAAEERIRGQARQLEVANARLAELASVDGLTGLKNRRTFFEDLELQLRSAHRGGHPLSVIMADVDRFKNFNDTFGHQAGDDVLRRAAEILGRLARATDTVARYGGEEFVIALPQTTAPASCWRRKGSGLASSGARGTTAR